MSIRLLPRARCRAATPEPGLVAVCMATYNPELELFRRQVASIRDQTHQHWRCIVNDDRRSPETYAAIRRVLGDDPRFELHRNNERLGFYFNFERALERVPPDAEAVALCDQDDEWHPDKLATLLADAARGPRARLLGSAHRQPGRGGARPGYWERRENQWTDLGRRGRLEHGDRRRVALPARPAGRRAARSRRELARRLPRPLARARAALACGTIGYVDEPLYDYVQHAGQVVGHVAGKATGADGAASRRHVTPPEHERCSAGSSRTSRTSSRRSSRRWRCSSAAARACGPDDLAALAALADGDATRRGILAQLRAVRALRAKDDGETFGALAGMAWRRWSRWRTRPPHVPFADQRHTLDARPSYVEYGPERGPQRDGSGRDRAGGRRRPWRTK